MLIIAVDEGSGVSKCGDDSSSNITPQIDRSINLRHCKSCVLVHVVLIHNPTLSAALVRVCKPRGGSGAGSKLSRATSIGRLFAGR
jgi:hypothetical protein